MKRYRYVVAATCLLLSAAGFVGLYATNQAKEKEEQAKNENLSQESEDIILGSNLFDTESEQEDLENQVADNEVEKPEDASSNFSQVLEELVQNEEKEQLPGE